MIKITTLGMSLPVKDSSRSGKSKAVIWFLILLCTFNSGCKKFVEVSSPDTNITQESAYKSDATAIAVLTGLYTTLSNEGGTSPTFTNISTTCAGLSSDEFTIYTGGTNTSQRGHYSNVLSASSSIGTKIWEIIYSYVYICNAAVEGLNSSNTLTPGIKKQLLGEAKFMRALFYFYLVNLYGDVPLAISPDYKVNHLLSRAPQDAVFSQMVSDLNEAKSQLNENFLDITLSRPTSERVRPSKAAATALLARVFLYQKEWIKAESESTELINNTALFDILPLNDVFLKNSKEAIFQLQPTTLFFNTNLARVLIITASGPSISRPIYLSNFLLKGFEPGDSRSVLGNWIGKRTAGGIDYYYPFKYKINTQNTSVTTPDLMTEYTMVLRLAEQYLIRSEARAQQNNLAGAIDDLDVIRKRAGLPLISATNPVIDKQPLLDAILHERQVELFSEWGHRWLDLKRTGKVNEVMSVITPLKGGTWEATDALYPLPNSDILNNPNLRQNEGY